MVDALSNIEFVNKDASQLSDLKFRNEFHVTHLYSFNKLISKDHNEKLKALIANCPKVQVLAWSLNERDTLDGELLKAGFKFYNQFPISTMGANQEFELYFYKRDSPNVKQTIEETKQAPII